jgi:RNase P/RNase MRP subunit p30
LQGVVVCAIIAPLTITRKAMKVTDLPKNVTLYELAKVLGITAPAAYKYKKTNKIPDLRVYQLKEKKPEWFKEETCTQ